MQERAKVLIVEDSQDVRTLLEMALSHGGFQIFSAPTGNSALLQLDIVKPDLIILDILMPGLDGWETLRRVRETSNVPVIVLTGLNNRKTRKYCREFGADYCMIKPVDIPELKVMAGRLLQRGKEAGSSSCVTFGNL
jgi:DNA-binding response OmpR family regulator